MIRFLSIVFVVGLALSGCKSRGVVGVYEFDKDTTLQRYKQFLEKLPQDKRKFAQQGYNKLRALNIQLWLQKGGQAEMKVSVKLFNQVSQRVHKGTGTQQGNTILVTTERQRHNGNKVTSYKQTIACSLDKGSLACRAQKKAKDNKQEIYFRKT